MNLQEKYDYLNSKFVISTYINGFKVYFHKSEIGYTMGQDKELATVLDNIGLAGAFINELYENYSREYHYKIEMVELKKESLLPLFADILRPFTKQILD